MSKRLKYYILSIFFWGHYAVFAQISVWHQQLDMRFDSLTNKIYVNQITGIKNNFSKSVSKLTWLNWANAFKHKHTELAKRIVENYNLKFHFSQQKQRGFVNLKQLLVNGQDRTAMFKIKNTDTYQYVLSKALNPGDSLVFNFQYVVKLPNAKFTGFGIDKNKNIFLRNFYFQVMPWDIMTYNHKNIDNYPEVPVFTEIRLHHFPKNKNIWSNLSGAKGILKGKGKNLTVEISSNTYHSFKMNDRQIILPANSSLSWDDQQQKLAQIILYIRQKIGLYLPKQCFISNQDLKKYRIYGLDLLPAFINPYPEDFKWELAILQQLAFKNLSYLKIDRRQNPWLIDGTINFLVYNYLQRFYPDYKLLGKLADFKLTKYYYASQVKLTHKYPWLYLYMARMNKDQAIYTSLDSLTNFNRNITSPYKAALGLMMLKDQNPHFDSQLKKLYNKAQNQWLTPKLFEKSLLLPNQKKWFNLYFKTTKKFDYKLKHLFQQKDTVIISIKNKRHNLLPLSLFGLKNNKIVWSKSLKAFKDDTVFKSQAPLNLDFVGINYFNNYPELQNNNNFKKVNRHFLSRDLQIRPYRDFENPLKNQLFVNPFFDYNYYDGAILGLQFFNESVLHNTFNYIITPTYGFKNRSLTGNFSLFNTTYFNRPSFYALSYGFKFSYFHYNHNLVYRKYNPSLTFKFRSSYLRQRKGHYIKFQYLYINKDPENQIISETDKYQIFDIKTHFYHVKIIKDLFVTTDLQLSQEFGKISTTLRYRFFTDQNRQWDFRLFAGKFLYNQTQTDYFSFALDRPTDYLFQYNYYGRSETSGIFHQQFIWAEGGFKSFFTNQFSNDFLISHNLTIGLWKWFSIYTDWAWLKQQKYPVKFYYDSGMRVNLVQDYFEVFLPINSNNGWEINQNSYLSKIRFIFTLDIKNLKKMFDRSWY